MIRYVDTVPLIDHCDSDCNNQINREYREYIRKIRLAWYELHAAPRWAPIFRIC